MSQTRRNVPAVASAWLPDMGRRRRLPHGRPSPRAWRFFDRAFPGFSSAGFPLSSQGFPRKIGLLIGVRRDGPRRRRRAFLGEGCTANFACRVCARWQRSVRPRHGGLMASSLASSSACSSASSSSYSPFLLLLLLLLDSSRRVMCRYLSFSALWCRHQTERTDADSGAETIGLVQKKKYALERCLFDTLDGR